MSILSTAYSGLNAFQRALSVTSSNITNATTEGYSRQSISFKPSAANFFGGVFVGTGVTVDSVYRNVDQFANFQVRSNASVKSQYEAFYQQSSQINNLLSLDGLSVSTSTQSFFDALSQLNNAPDSVTSRNTFLKQGQQMVQQFTYLQGKLDEYQNNSTRQIGEAVNTINQLTSNLAQINQQLMSVPQAPDLLDQRDKLLNTLSQYANLTVSDQGNGVVNVGLASGEMLVSGPTQNKLSISTERTNDFSTKVLLAYGNSGQIDVTNKLNSGMVGGLLSYEQSVLGRASQSLGMMAIGLAQQFNAQHQMGVTMNGQLGGNFFTDFNSASNQSSRVVSQSTNTGTASLGVEISDLSSLELTDYTMVISDTNEVQLIRKSDGVVATKTWNSTTAPLQTLSLMV